MSAVKIGIAVVERDDQFLIGPRGSDQVLAGKWEFPGGKVETGESPSATAVRECGEETGLTVEVVEEMLVHTESYEYGTVELHFFLCRVVTEKGALPDGSAGASPSHDADAAPRAPFRWVHRSRLNEYEFPSGNRELLELVQS